MLQILPNAGHISNQMLLFFFTLKFATTELVLHFEVLVKVVSENSDFKKKFCGSGGGEGIPPDPPSGLALTALAAASIQPHTVKKT